MALQPSKQAELLNAIRMSQEILSGPPLNDQQGAEQEEPLDQSALDDFHRSMLRSMEELLLQEGTGTGSPSGSTRQQKLSPPVMHKDRGWAGRASKEAPSPASALSNVEVKQLSREVRGERARRGSQIGKLRSQASPRISLPLHASLERRQSRCSLPRT